ncbi:unnamed protein product [Durusdinium trenchii]|uniref:Uncharacterized protein n=1 Tax=Durusdinium trenchii TaxID=1381693 RepID=A0ABP0Q3H5_9DINO
MVQFELDQFREEFNQLYEKMVDEEELGLDLSSVPTDEVIHKALLSQLHAHHFPLWLEQLDVQQTFEELRLAGVTGFAGIKDDNVALLNFVEQLTISHNLRAGKMFWRNVYRLWLLRCAQMADHDIARRMRTFVEKFNKENPELAASYQHGPVKTEERTRHKEKTLGFVPSAESFDGRSSASRILDVVRGSITVKSPKAVLKLMESFKKLDRSMDRMILVRQINRFNREAETLEGYRFMEMHVLFRNGVRAASCGREGKTIEVDLLGEVCIVLEDFLQIHKRRHLLFKIKQGIFDWTAEDEEPDADVDLDSSLRGDDLPQ